MLTRFLFWRLLGLIAGLLGAALALWLLDGGVGALLRGTHRTSAAPSWGSIPSALGAGLRWGWTVRLAGGPPLARVAVAATGAAVGALLAGRALARRGRRYHRMRVAVHRIDKATPEALVAMFDALHKRLLRRWWRRLFAGQPSVALEVHLADGEASLAVSCPLGSEDLVESALRGAYPNLRLLRSATQLHSPRCLLRLKKRTRFIEPLRVVDPREREDSPTNRLLTALGTLETDAVVQLALTPAPPLFERWARRRFRRREAALSAFGGVPGDRRRSEVEIAELRDGLDLQHRPLFFADLRVMAAERRACETIAAELRSRGAHNALVERGTTVRQGWLRCYDRRLQRGEGNPLPSFHRGVLASTELPQLWQLPSIDYLAIPFARTALPVAPASPAILRPADGPGCLRDARGPVSIHPDLRRQHVAVPGTVDQGKSSFLVATIAEDLLREDCALIVLDPKGDAAEAALSLVSEDRVCTLLDFAHPTCGFNPLSAQAPADVIADYVVGALRNLFTDADIRASSDRYLRNAVIAVLAADTNASLWDAARLLSVGEEGYAYRRRVGSRVRGMPEFKEISEFFTSELSAQLADARSMTTSKLDSPVNKLARLLNSASIKRVLLNDSLEVDLDRVIRERQVLIVKGALGEMGSGNTSVLMQLIVGMLDAALARQQDRLAQAERVAVALKVDEAPLVINRGFADTMALKRSAGLETVACWQTDSQWTDRDVRDQLDALFAHRVYFATASVADARAAASLMMAEFVDSVRSGERESLSAVGRPDARLHLPKHHAIASWTTPAGRQPPFVAQTIPLRVRPERLAAHAARQAARGGRYLADLRQPHWDAQPTGGPAPAVVNGAPAAPSADADARPVDGVPAVVDGAPAVVDRVPAGVDRAPAAASAGHVEAGGDGAGAHPLDGRRPVRSKGTPPPAPPATSGGGPPGPPPASYRELVDVDGAHRARWAPSPPAPSRAPAPDALDLEILLVVARFGHVLSSQLHRRYHPTRSVTTTQRRLKRLAEAGWIARFQFHRRDGGGVPMCCVIRDAGLELLAAHDRLPGAAGARDAPAPPPNGRDVNLGQARHEVHVIGWVLALQRCAGQASTSTRGPWESVLSPTRRVDGRSAAIGVSDLRLPGGRVPHDFLRTGAGGERHEIEHFETVRPDATVELRETAGDGRIETSDLLVEFDDRSPVGAAAAKLERYDHLVSGWSVHTGRYGRQLGAPPLVVFVCRDRARARECARRADAVLTACRAYNGEYPADWQYPGRERILFAAERDAHEGRLCAYGVDPLPPQVRAERAGGDPASRAAEPRERQLPGAPLARTRS